jgi:glutaredoxin 3
VAELVDRNSARGEGAGGGGGALEKRRRDYSERDRERKGRCRTDETRPCKGLPDEDAAAGRRRRRNRIKCLSGRQMSRAGERIERELLSRIERAIVLVRPGLPASRFLPRTTPRCTKPKMTQPQHRYPVPAAIDPSAFVMENVTSHAVTCFTKAGCPHCANASRILREAGAHPHLVEVDTKLAHGDAEAVQHELLRMTGAGTVPRVFVGGRCIGGEDDTIRASQSGELKSALASAAGH